ncbi:hypothetical protein STHU_02270 [Allostella humosa]|uniref:HAD family hydrolase n=1 Tax=Stella humosa TaxID=94 RepID=UPI00113B9ADB|nr:HAD family hydrolase [Stella humosa]BBK29593.1 hypothetical protein STHU_02270 [Stella humosa]
MTAGPRRAVLFDVGGPLDQETAFEQRIDGVILAALAAEGCRLDPGAYDRLCGAAVASFAPNLYEAVVWSALGGDRDACGRAMVAVAGRMAADPPAFELRPGMADLLAGLHGRGVRLGLVANQPASALERLAAGGLAPYFDHFAVSGTNGFRKPDVRAFLAAATALAVAPAECVMVGDRIDNDIAPARLLGMAAVRLRTGRHAGQRPRSLREVPDADVADVPGLALAIDRLLAG